MNTEPAPNSWELGYVFDATSSTPKIVTGVLFNPKLPKNQGASGQENPPLSSPLPPSKWTSPSLPRRERRESVVLSPPTHLHHHQIALLPTRLSRRRESRQWPMWVTSPTSPSASKPLSELPTLRRIMTSSMHQLWKIKTRFVGDSRQEKYAS